MSRIGRIPLLLIALAVALLAVGVVLYLSGRSAPTSYGWFGYAPLSGVPQLSVVVWTHRQVTGAALAALGLMAGASAAGYAAGTHRASRRVSASAGS